MNKINIEQIAFGWVHVISLYALVFFHRRSRIIINPTETSGRAIATVIAMAFETVTSRFSRLSVVVSINQVLLLAAFKNCSGKFDDKSKFSIYSNLLNISPAEVLRKAE